MRNEWPIHFLTATAIFPENKSLHAYVGTGNRYSLLDEDAGICRFDNPVACAKYDCDEVKTVYKIKKGTHEIKHSETHWKDLKFEHTKLDVGSLSQSFCGTSAGETVVTAEFADAKINNCPGASPGDIRKIKYECGRDAALNFRCRRVDANTTNFDDIEVTRSTTGLGKNRFYGIWAYGRRADRMFDETLTATAANKQTAKQFDAARLTDRTSLDTVAGDLVDVTATTCDSLGSCTGNLATVDSNGWFFDYERLADKTASGSAVLASCAMWNTIYPQVTTNECGKYIKSYSRFTQGDIYSGAPNCAYSFKDKTNDQWLRYQQREVLAPPPEPATAIQISKTGQIKYSTLVLEPGKDQATEVSVSAGQDRLQLIYELPIDQALHKCRHEGSQYCTPSP